MKRYSILILFFLVSNLGATGWAEKTLEKLSLREKIGQLIMIDIRPSIEESDFKSSFFMDVPVASKEGYIQWILDTIKTYNIGGLLLMRGKAQECPALINRLQRESYLPLIVAIEAECGLAMRFSDVEPLPYQMTLGALLPKYNGVIYQMGKMVGQQCRKLGIHVNFAPVVDVNADPNDPIINHRSFGQNKDNVADKAAAYMSGLQEAGVISVAKNFSGVSDHGDLFHRSLNEPFVSKNLISDDLCPFEYLVKNNIGGVVASQLDMKGFRDGDSSIYPSSLASGFLRDELEYKGLVFADTMMMKSLATHSSPGQAALLALRSGVDINVMPENIDAVVTFLEKEMQENPGLVALLDQAVLRILGAKEKCNLHLNRETSENISVSELNEEICSLRKTLFSHAITLVRDQNNVVTYRSRLQFKDRHVAYIHIGESDNGVSPLYNTLAEFVNVSRFYLPWSAQEQEIENLLSELTDSFVVIGLHDMTYQPKDKFGVTQNVLQFLKRLNERRIPSVVVVFGNPYSLTYLREIGSVFVAYQDLPEAHDAIAKILLGYAAAEGRLPINIDE